MHHQRPVQSTYSTPCPAPPYASGTRHPPDLPCAFPGVEPTSNPRWVSLSPRTPPAVGAVGRTDLSAHYVLPQCDTLGAAPPVVRR
jgi:hypothetical protein